MHTSTRFTLSRENVWHSLDGQQRFERSWIRRRIVCVVARWSFPDGWTTNYSSSLDLPGVLSSDELNVVKYLPLATSLFAIESASIATPGIPPITSDIPHRWYSRMDSWARGTTLDSEWHGRKWIGPEWSFAGIQCASRYWEYSRELHPVDLAVGHECIVTLECVVRVRRQLCDGDERSFVPTQEDRCWTGDTPSRLAVSSRLFGEVLPFACTNECKWHHPYSNTQVERAVGVRQRSNNMARCCWSEVQQSDGRERWISGSLRD